MFESRLAVRAVAQIAAEAAREASPDFRVAGVMPANGGMSYVEILVSVDGGHVASRQITLGVFRNVGAAAIKKQIVESLQRQLDVNRRRS